MEPELGAGPAAGAAWTAAPGGIMVLPDAANEQRAEAGLGALYHGLPLTPRLTRDAANKPVLSLTLILRRRPAPDEDSVFELVESAALAFDVSAALPDGVDAAVSPLFARAVELVLARDSADAAAVEAAPLAQGNASGAGWRAGMAARLAGVDAQAVLAALDGQPSGLALRCRVDYRASGRRERLRLAIRWREVHAFLDTHDDENGFSGAALRALLPELVEAGALDAWRIENDGAEAILEPEEADALWPAFAMLGSAVLERLTPALAPTDPQARFALRSGAIAAGEMNTQWTLGSAREESVKLEAPLETLLGAVLDGADTEDFIHLVCPDPAASSGYTAVPRRLRVLPARAGPQAPPAGMTLVGDTMLSMTRALEPDRSRAPPLAAMLASDRIQHHAGVGNAFSVHAIELAENGAPPLPRVNDPNGALWADHTDPRRFWYAPEYELLQPDPAAGSAASAFLFTFRQVGHDGAGNPALEGLVRFTLQRKAGAATLALLGERGNPAAFPVPATGIALSLSLPVRDDAGVLRRVELAAGVSVADNGERLVAEVPLLAAYVRAAYGALALAGFQSEPARLQLAYSFEAMVPSQQFELTLAHVGKVAQTPVAYTAAQQAQLAGRTHMDALQLAYRAPVSDVQFRREAALDARREPALALADAAGEGAVAPARVRPEARAAAGVGTLAVQGHVAQPVADIRPQLDHSLQVQDMLARRRYARQTQGRQAAVDAFFPCTSLGAFYCQQADDGALAAIGCREAFSLGQIPLALYEQVTDPALAGLPCKLLRSLTQPGRFVLLPAVYLITRFGPAEGARAWRPAIYLYSTLDPLAPANNRCVLMATLQPDLDLDQRHRIDAVLARLHASPVLDAITAIDAAVEHSDWLAGLAPEVARLWDGFQVSLSTDVAGALMLQEMLRHGGAAASITFTLADGSELASSLQLDLNRLTGPWDAGPVELETEGANALLTNRIERAVDVHDLMVLDALGAASGVAVERRLAPGEALALALPAGSRPGWAVYTIPPGDAATLDEVRSFVENVQTNVLFINIINYANHGLKRLDLRARLKEVAGSERAVTMNEEQTMGEAAFMLPLTVYQGPRTLQFQVQKTGLDGAVAGTAWLEADLRAGNAVTLSWELIA